MAKFTPFGYSNDPKTFKEFMSDVETATDAKNGACWALGDLYNLAESRWRDKTDQAFTETKITLETLRNYATVCRVFPRKRRVYDLSFSHYDVVKTMDESAQDKLLSDAVNKHWSRKQLRDARHEYLEIKKQESIKTQCKVIDIVKHLIEDFGLAENDTIDITAKLISDTETKGLAA